MGQNRLVFEGYPPPLTQNFPPRPPQNFRASATTDNNPPTVQLGTFMIARNGSRKLQIRVFTEYCLFWENAG